MKKRKAKQRNFLSHWCHKPPCIFCKTWEGAADYFIRKYEKIEGFVSCQKFPRQPKNSRAWAWVLQPNIMGLNFKTYPTENSLSTNKNNNNGYRLYAPPRDHSSSQTWTTFVYNADRMLTQVSRFEIPFKD